MSRNLAQSTIAFGVFSAICYFGATVIVTVVLAILTAYMLDPLVHLLTRLRFPKSLGITISMLVATVLIGVVIILFLDRADDFAGNLPRYRAKIQKISNQVSKKILALEKRSEDISQTILPRSVQQQAKPMIVEFDSRWTTYLFRNAGAYLIQISFFPFLVYFLLTEKDRIRLFLTSVIRGRTDLSTTVAVDTSSKVVHEINHNIKGFVVGYLLSTLILFVFAWILFLSFQADEAVIWAFIFALLNILPFVGAILSVIPPLVIAILDFASFEKGLVLVILCVVLHLFYANWLIPKTTGPRTALSPLVVLLAMMYWGFLWGAIGIFLAIPITASLRSIWSIYNRLLRLEEERQEIQSVEVLSGD